VKAWNNIAAGNSKCRRHFLTLSGGWKNDIYCYKFEVLLNSIYKFSPYLTGNTLRLSYKAQPVNAVREIIAVCCDNHAEHTNTLCGKMRSSSMVNIITTRL
jgi:hypothetical protein